MAKKTRSILERKFNGKWYRFKTYKENKYLAKITAVSYREKGYNARIVKAHKKMRTRKLNWLIYLRKK